MILHGFLMAMFTKLSMVLDVAFYQTRKIRTMDTDYLADSSRRSNTAVLLAYSISKFCTGQLGNDESICVHPSAMYACLLAVYR